MIALEAFQGTVEGTPPLPGTQRGDVYVYLRQTVQTLAQRAENRTTWLQDEIMAMLHGTDIAFASDGSTVRICASCGVQVVCDGTDATELIAAFQRDLALIDGRLALLIRKASN